MVGTLTLNYESGIMEEEQEKKHKQGRPWKKSFTYWTFEEADLKRKEVLSENSDMEAKVKRHLVTTGEQFVVKTRKIQKTEEVAN